MTTEEQDQAYIILNDSGKSTGKHARITTAKARFVKNESFCFSPSLHICGNLEAVRQYITDNTKGKKQRDDLMSHLYTHDSTSEGGSMEVQFNHEVKMVRDSSRVEVPSIPRGFDFELISKAFVNYYKQFERQTKVRAGSPVPVRT
jgi:hypothetical protein